MAIEIGISKGTSLKVKAGGSEDENVKDKGVKVDSLYSQYQTIGKDSQNIINVNTDEAHNYINRKR